MDVLTIVVRFASYADLTLLFGLAAFDLYDATHMTAIRAFTLLAALAAPVLAVAKISLLAATMGGVALTEIDRATVTMVLQQTIVGEAWQVQMLALAVTLILLMIAALRRDQLLKSATLLSAAIALGALAWSGHGVAGEGALGTVQLGSDIVHLLAAGVWIGALFAFALMFARSQTSLADRDLEAAQRSLARFSVVGTIAVAAIVATGLVNSAMLVGVANIPMLTSTLYGRLLALKLVVFVAMLALAAANRFRLTPALASGLGDGDPRAAVRALRRSLIVETAAAFAVLALVAWFGTLEPPITVGI